MSVTDVPMPTYTGELTVGRSFTTLAVGGTPGVFGPGWTASTPGPAAGSADRTLTDNTASYGNGAWQVTTTEHDAKGNTIRTLSAENRNQALTPTADTDMTVAALTSSAARAQQLDEQTVYSSDGVSVTDTYGPTHQIVDNAGARYSGREHVHTDYDQGAPSAPDPYRLATTITTSTRLVGGTGEAAVGLPPEPKTNR